MSERIEIVELLGRYVRALEDRDAKALTELFAVDGEFRLYSRPSTGEFTERPLGAVGRVKIMALFESASRSQGRGIHYMTSDHIVEVDGDRATLTAQFMAVESNSELPSNAEWSSGATLLRGSLVPTMMGRYESDLRRIDGRWLFSVHRVKQNLALKS